MREYYIDYNIDLDSYFVKAKNESFAIVFSDKNKAHSHMLSLTLQTMSDPLQSPDLYDEFDNEDGLHFYSFKNIENNDDTSDWADEGCCQSGCPGCPWTLSQIDRLNQSDLQ